LANGGEVRYVEERALKSAKKSSKGKSKNVSAPSSPNIEGSYVYIGCSENVFQANIDCGSFGNGDEDLCLFQEFKVGKLSASTSAGAVAVASIFYTPEIGEGQATNPSESCVFSGSFRRSATVIGNTVLPIPLATSDGCENVKENFLYVAKFGIMMDGKLNLSFSRDGGFEYYTDDVTCPDKYIGYKSSSKAEYTTKRAAVAVCDASGRHLVGQQLVDTDTDLENHGRELHGRRLCPPCVFLVGVVTPIAVGIIGAGGTICAAKC